MADQIKAFRWLGKGVLHIKGRADGKVVVVPPYQPGVVEHGCLVKDPMNIEALGQERIAGLIKEGKAERITWTQEVASVLRPDAKPYNAATGEGDIEAAAIEQARKIAQDSYDASAAAKAAFGQPADSVSTAIPAAPSSLPR